MRLAGGHTAAALVGAVAVSVAATGPAVALTPVAPTPGEAATETVLDTSPEACARCHQPIVTAWRGSMHARAFSDPIFRAEYEPAPAASCRGCHDPAGGGEDGHGIDCATCHVQDGQILATGASARGRRAHPIRVDPGLDSPARCGTCHQFDHSDDGTHDPTEPLQATLDEWRGSEAAVQGVGCIDCHMADRGVSRGHELLGLASSTLMAEAIEVRLEPRRGDDGLVVDVTIEGDAIGHAFPTGDIFRRAVLTLRTSDGAQASVSLQRWEARTADPDGIDTHVRTVDDTRVPAPGRGPWRERVELPGATSDRIDWSIELHRLALDVADVRGLSRADVVVPVQSGRAWIGRP